MLIKLKMDCTHDQIAVTFATVRKPKSVEEHNGDHRKNNSATSMITRMVFFLTI